MTTPIDGVTAIHNAFRHDIADIDQAALAWARGDDGATPVLERLRFLNEVLVWHATGEEIGVFPVLESVAPSVAEAYEKDHRGLDAAFETLSEAIAAGDRLETARASAAFKFHLDFHLYKEDTHLYRLFAERIPVPEQGKAVGALSRSAPPERSPEVIAWMFPLMGDDDRENMLRILQQVNPPEVFAQIAGLAQQATGAGWAELQRRIPGLGGS